MKTIIAGLVLSLALALAPAPRVNLQNPNLLYAAAMYKTAIGDTESALRLMHRADQARQSTRPAHSNNPQTACGRAPTPTIL